MVVYQFNYLCADSYVCMTSRKFGKRIKEHTFWQPSKLDMVPGKHCKKFSFRNISCYVIAIDIFNILFSECQLTFSIFFNIFN